MMNDECWETVCASNRFFDFFNKKQIFKDGLPTAYVWFDWAFPKLKLLGYRI